MVCPSCGTENRGGRKFCAECGSPLARACPACGAANGAGERFCGECGVRLDAEAPIAAAAPAAERRLVSVLFADLVGFTTASEGRDAEETRELLSRYFDTCRTLIERYGGTVEKFIGDAVMAVWGTPVAQEDDPERAVRTALDLVAAVPELHPALQARAGVLTGEAAVTIGAEGQGMVAGDLVNTASRIQSIAQPGTVLVGESTRRASEAAIAYDDAGEHELKGKAEPVPLWRALRVTAARGGALKSAGLEPPFVGRDRELRLVKELFHASAEEGKAHLVSVLALAGLGKSRLGWEFYKYIDGLADLILWHRGRCLAYGEGVAYWALAEMVRMRAEIAEGEEPEAARAKLRAVIEQWIADTGERTWLEPRLAHLLGLEEGARYEREDLFAAWRLFLERLAEQRPLVMVFEDMHWADDGLLDFVQYLLEWSRNHAIFVLALSRPEFGERQPAARNVTTLSLEPLPEGVMAALLDGFVPGLPPELRAQILARAQGVPLYAVETVRMLLDRGLLVREGAEYRPAGEIAALDVPETLHALIAARLDGLSAEERRLLQDASVLGKSFSLEALAALDGVTGAELESLLQALVRKEVLSIQADPRSPERGQYGFLQDLVKQVAYETLSRHDRKARHLAAAAYLERDWGPAEQEIVEVVAAHFVAAFEAAPDADDAPEIRARAQETVARAGERASSLGANEEAQRYFEQAAGLSEQPRAKAELLERAGNRAWMSARYDEAERLLEEAIALFEGEGETHPAARVSARLADVLWATGRIARAVERLEQAFAVLSQEERDADLAALAAQLGRFLYFTGEVALAAERIEFALDLAEALRLPEVISHALNTKSLVLGRRPEEALALLRRALEIALEHDLPSAALRAYNNLCVVAQSRDRYDEVLGYAESGLALSRRFGDRFWELRMLAVMAEARFDTGDWDGALHSAAEIPEEAHSGSVFLIAVPVLVGVRVGRGELEEARRLAGLVEAVTPSADVQEVGVLALVRAIIRCAEGRHAEALVAAGAALAAFRVGVNVGNAVEAFVEACEAALALGDFDKTRELLAEYDSLPLVERTQLLDAHVARFNGRLAAARGDATRADQSFRAAVARFRELGMPFPLAVALLEQGEWLAGEGGPDEAEPLLAEAREIFERLGAKPRLQRLDRVRVPAEVAG